MKPFLLFVPVVFALQVTPNSPCSALCIDNSSLDVSDPNSSNTNTSDIVCPDSDYDTTDAGRKFKSCLSCLQNSTFAQGPENDQAWFICKRTTVACMALTGQITFVSLSINASSTARAAPA